MPSSGLPAKNASPPNSGSSGPAGAPSAPGPNAPEPSADDSPLSEITEAESPAASEITEAESPAASEPRRWRPGRGSLVFATACLVLNLVAANLSFDLQAVGGRVRTGSYGLTAYTMPARPPEGSAPDTERRSRVVLLGNSVLQSTQVGPELDLLNESTGSRLELGNFSQTGASIADLLFAYQHVKQFEPDLLVVQVCALTFGYGWPLFRTDNYKNGPRAGYADLLRLPSIKAALDRNDYVEMGVYTYLPAYRYVAPLRGGLQRVAGRHVDSQLGLPLMSFFPASLNLAQDYDTKLKREIKTSEYPGARALLFAFLSRLEADGQRTLLISQESSLPPLPSMREIPRILARSKYIRFVDHSDHHSQDLFSDTIHPTPLGAKQVAQRVFEAIRSTTTLGN